MTVEMESYNLNVKGGDISISNVKRNDGDVKRNYEDYVHPLTESESSWSESSLRLVRNDSPRVCSLEGGLWSGFLLEEFPKYGSKEFIKLRKEKWPRFGLTSGQDYNCKPSTPIPDWAKKLGNDAKVKLVTKISEVFGRLHPEQKYDTDWDDAEISRDEPKISEEILGKLCKEVSCSMDEIRELTRFVWQQKWLLFSDDHHPKWWFQLLGGKEFATELYTHNVGKGNFLKGVWGLILTEAFEFEKQKGDKWEQRRRYQNLDGTSIRPIMTVYKEMRDLGVKSAELLDLLFGTLPGDAFGDLNKQKSYWKKDTPKKKRPVKVSFDILMISDIQTILQRFDCKFTINWRWKQTLNGARLYYVKEQLDELDEISTSKELVFKAEWTPPDCSIRNAVREEKTQSKPPFVLKNDYTTLHSSETYLATFSEKLELGNFPFDCQEFTMTFDLQGNDYYLTGRRKKFLEINWENFALSEWKPSTNAVDCRIHRITRRADPSTITIAFKLERDPSSFVYKLVLTSFMICSGTFVFFGTDVGELGDRVAYIATMFLTGQAFQVVARAETPLLGYLTMIDYFLVGGNIFTYILLVVSVLITLYASGESIQGNTLEEGDPGDSVNISCLLFFSILYGSFCITWSLYAVFICIPNEQSKLLATPLKLGAKGFLYILSYLDDVSVPNTVNRPRLSTLTSNADEREQCTNIHKEVTQVTRIIGKKVNEDGNEMIMSLLDDGLSKAITSFFDEGCVRDPQWKTRARTNVMHAHTYAYSHEVVRGSIRPRAKTKT